MLLIDIWKRKGVLLATLFLMVNGCVTFHDTEPPAGVAWHSFYEPIDSPALRSFMEASLQEATALLGDPSEPIMEVKLRRSRKRPAWRHLRIAEDFSLTERVPNTSGDVVIYLGVDADSDEVWFLLAHEVVHVLNPEVKDWYMEGLASYFAITFCEARFGSSGGWRTRFENMENEPYACSYRMMRAVAEVAPEAMRRMVDFVVADETRLDWQRIDVNGWLASMSVEERKLVLEKIKPYVKQLVARPADKVAFTVPDVFGW